MASAVPVSTTAQPDSSCTVNGSPSSAAPQRMPNTGIRNVTVTARAAPIRGSSRRSTGHRPGERGADAAGGHHAARPNAERARRLRKPGHTAPRRPITAAAADRPRWNRSRPSIDFDAIETPARDAARSRARRTEPHGRHGQREQPATRASSTENASIASRSRFADRSAARPTRRCAQRSRCPSLRAPARRSARSRRATRRRKVAPNIGVVALSTRGRAGGHAIEPEPRASRARHLPAITRSWPPPHAARPGRPSISPASRASISGHDRSPAAPAAMIAPAPRRSAQHEQHHRAPRRRARRSARPARMPARRRAASGTRRPRSRRSAACRAGRGARPRPRATCRAASCSAHRAVVRHRGHRGPHQCRHADLAELARSGRRWEPIAQTQPWRDGGSRCCWWPSPPPSPTVAASATGPMAGTATARR